MKILFIGEIVGGLGRKTVKEVLPGLIKDNKPDFILANAENLSNGRGVTQEKIEEMRLAGIDFFTSGDHIFRERNTEDLIENMPIVRPANYPKGVPGKGYEIVDSGKYGKVLVVNLMGRTSFSSLFSYFDDPFKKADEILELTAKEDLAAIIVDFHADATSEKYALAHYLDGRVTAVLGTSSHVPTCDNMLLPKGTLFVSDVGMTGSVDSVIGVKSEIIIRMFLTAQNQKFEWEKSGRTSFRSVLLDTKEHTIERLDRILS